MIDSHAHLDFESFDEDRDEIIENFKDIGIDAVVNIGCDLESSQKAIELSEKYEKIYATIGVHPHDAKTYTDEVEKSLIELSKNKKVLAIGEIGLDFHYDYSPRDVQQEVFKRQIELAHNLGLPIVIHSREASMQTLNILKEYHEKFEFRALLHCFSQSVEMMREYLALGDYIALGGAVTFKNSKTPKLVAREVPLDRLLLETDCPFMTPVPYRGKRNEPKYIFETAKYIAELRDMNVHELIKNTDRATREFYGF